VAELDHADKHHDPEAEDTTEEVNSNPIDIILAHVAKQGSFRPSMKQEVWKKLSKDGQETWDKLSNDNKANILGYTNKKLKTRSDGERAAFISKVLTQVQGDEKANRSHCTVSYCCSNCSRRQKNERTE
jgi:hypothetical protein